MFISIILLTPKRINVKLTKLSDSKSHDTSRELSSNEGLFLSIDLIASFKQVRVHVSMLQYLSKCISEDGFIYLQ